MISCLTEENLQAYLDGELTAAAGGAARAHLAACPRCAAAARGMEQAFAKIGLMIDAASPDAVPTVRLRARIEAALAEQAEPKLSWAQLLWRFGVVAALVLIFAGVTGWFVTGMRSARSPQSDRPALTGLPASPMTPEPPAPLPPTLERESVAVRPHPRPRRRVRQRAFENGSEEAEVVTRFFPLREGEDFTALESMRLVRVELPGSALGEVGLPAALDAASTPVKADVVLGDDGLARTIRFVR
jgi:Putative zinc-finger